MTPEMISEVVEAARAELLDAQAMYMRLSENDDAASGASITSAAERRNAAIDAIADCPIETLDEGRRLLVALFSISSLSSEADEMLLTAVFDLSQRMVRLAESDPIRADVRLPANRRRRRADRSFNPLIIIGRLVSSSSRPQL